MSEKDAYFSIPVVAKVLGVSLPTAYSWVRKGYLKTTKMICDKNGKEMSVVLREDVYEFKKNQMPYVYHYTPRKKKEMGIINRILEWFRDAI